MQIIYALEDPDNRWYNHPAVRMWRGYKMALTLYYNLCIKEWRRRGYNNTMKLRCISDEVVYPSWFGSKKFHEAHQSNLVRKDKKFYRRYFPDVRADLPYVWPA